MPIIRNTNQKRQTLIEFYEESKNSSNEFSRKAGALMLSWIERINQELKETEIWGLTSHDFLIFQTKNDYTSDTFVVLITGSDTFHIEYLVPKEEEPWQNAYTKGETKSLDEAMIMLRIAMLKSKGWKESNELKYE